MKPKGRDPMKTVAAPGKRSDSVNETGKDSATSAYSMPNTWMGRLMYILFNARTGR
jgi:hypothetical protein